MKYALTGVNVLDVEGLTVNENSTILIEGKNILSVSKSTFIPSDAISIDASGKHASPSLIDMHTHVTFNSHGHLQSLALCPDNKEESELITFQNLRKALEVGICAVRDLGNNNLSIERVKQIANEHVLLPHISHSSYPLCLKGGHGSEFGYFLRDTTNKEIELYCMRIIKNGATWIKIMNDPENWNLEHIARVVQIAHSFGLKASVHAFTDIGIEAAVIANADTIEHCAVGNPKLHEQVAKQDTVFVPTFFCSHSSLSRFFMHTVTEIEKNYLLFWRDKLRKDIDFHISNQLPLLIGTDAGVPPCSFHEIFDEMGSLQDLGMDSFEVIRSATISAAHILGISKKFGSIASGKYANFILTDKNPLESVYNLGSPKLVLFMGLDIVNRMGARWH